MPTTQPAHIIRGWHKQILKCWITSSYENSSHHTKPNCTNRIPHRKQTEPPPPPPPQTTTTTTRASPPRTPLNQSAAKPKPSQRRATYLGAGEAGVTRSDLESEGAQQRQHSIGDSDAASASAPTRAKGKAR